MSIKRQRATVDVKLHRHNQRGRRVHQSLVHGRRVKHIEAIPEDDVIILAVRWVRACGRGSGSTSVVPVRIGSRVHSFFFHESMAVAVGALAARSVCLLEYGSMYGGSTDGALAARLKAWRRNALNGLR